MTVIDWLLDSDPSIRWQVMRDLTREPADEAFALIVAIAGGELRDVSAIAEILARWRSAHR